MTQNTPHSLATISNTESVATELPSVAEQHIVEIAQKINIADPSIDVTYGTSTMQGISRFADDLLARVRAKDSGEVGEALTSLMLRVKDVDVSEMGKEKGFLEKLPIIGSLFNNAKHTLAKFDTLAEQVETISGKLDDAMVGLLHDVEIMEQLYKHNESFYHDLTAHIEAGKRRLDEARNIELPKLQAEAAASNNALDAQKVRDFADHISRFERRLHDLEISRTITIQSAPQIRLIQSNNRALAQKIQTSILTTIPIWKNQMIIALSLQGQRNAATLQKEVADTTNDMLRKNAAMLEQTAVATAHEVERSIVDIETLRDVHTRLINTVDETLRIAQDGRQKRIAVEKELVHMEKQLKENLTSLAARHTQQSIAHASGRS